MLDYKLPETGHIKQLFELACTPFDMGSFEKKWKQLGWQYSPADFDEFGFELEMPGHEGQVWVEPKDCLIVSLRFLFCAWADYDPQFHPEPNHHGNDKELFDKVFEQSLDRAIQALGQPFLRWQDDDEDGHQAAVWEGSHGLLLLQQANLDPAHVGYEVDFWLIECAREEFDPATPLIDWLVAWSQKKQSAEA